VLLFWVHTSLSSVSCTRALRNPPPYTLSTTWAATVKTTSSIIHPAFDPISKPSTSPALGICFNRKALHSPSNRKKSASTRFQPTWPRISKNILTNIIKSETRESTNKVSTTVSQWLRKSSNPANKLFWPLRTRLTVKISGINTKPH
jgi:hypothetical protein